MGLQFESNSLSPDLNIGATTAILSSLGIIPVRNDRLYMFLDSF